MNRPAGCDYTRRSSRDAFPCANAQSHRGGPRRRLRGTRLQVSRARSLLERFRRASLLAVALTSLILLLVDTQAATGMPLAGAQTESAAATSEQHVASNTSGEQAVESEPVTTADEVAEATGDEAKRAFSQFSNAVLGSLPKLTVALAMLVIAWVVVRTFRVVLRRTLGDWPRSTAVAALLGVAVWVLAIAVSVSVIAGDVRAFLGSVGLLGLAASWALQTPIESFTGWLLNAFKGYYRVGDRVEVGDVFGDVHRIDVLTTTVWEIGNPFRPGFVRAEQPTGRLITFPNNQILTGSVMNMTRDFPYVWDELNVAIANESDLRYAARVLQAKATEFMGVPMSEAAPLYQRILERSGLEDVVSSAPEVFVSVENAWTSLQVRYLVHARQRRRHKSELSLLLSQELNRSEHAGRIISVIPRQQLQFIDTRGLPRNAAWFVPSGDTFDD